MSNTDTDDTGAVTSALRTVTPTPRGRRDTEMDAIGLGLALGLVLLFLPLLPWLVIGWVAIKLVELLFGPPGESA